MSATLKRNRAIAAGALIELARRGLLDFAKLVDGTFETPPHIQRIAALLEDIEASRLRRLIVTLPPRHGKSRLLQIFEAWYLGRNQRKNVITVSNAAELAERNSRATRTIFGHDHWPFDCRLSADSSAMHRWNITPGGGGLYAVGVDGAITGRGADLLVLDDVEHDATSQIERDNAWRYYSEIAVPRLEPNAAVVCIATRWAEDDIPGRLTLAPGGEPWTVLSLPAVAAANDPMGRKLGEALWPNRFSIEELAERRMAMGSRAFESQFNQSPLPAEGALFKSEWLKKRYDYACPPDFVRKVGGLDAAAKTGVSNDYSVVVTIGVAQAAFYVLDVVRRRVEYPELVRMALNAHDKSQLSALYVEDTSNAIALIQELRREGRFPIVRVRPEGSKMARVEAITGLLEAGKVCLPEDAPWLAGFERELLAFPNGKHDDQVDAFTLALSQAAHRPLVMAWAG